MNDFSMDDLGISDTKAVDEWKGGNPKILIERVLSGRLSDDERELIVSIIRGNAPKQERGPKLFSLKPVVAGLVRFWLRDVDGVEKEDSVLKSIEDRLCVSNTMARKYLTNLDNPKTSKQKKQRFIFDTQRSMRWVLSTSTDPEHVEILAEVRQRDLKPISDN